jgi:hypothetical protein
MEAILAVAVAATRRQPLMKDPASGPEGFLPFVRAVLTGLMS